MQPGGATAQFGFASLGRVKVDKLGGQAIVRPLRRDDNLGRRSRVLGRRLAGKRGLYATQLLQTRSLGHVAADANSGRIAEDAAREPSEDLLRSHFNEGGRTLR